MRLIFLLSFLALNQGLVAGFALQERNYNPPRAAYTLQNNPDGNYILALAISSKDGTLSSPVKTNTQGKGLLGVNAGPDGLFGQGAVEISQNYLFTVNPGSNTLSMFRIDPRDVLHPKLVGEPANTLGEFPLSVTYSSALKQACVLNGGATAGVTCFSVDHAAGLKVLGGLRPISQGLHQTTPPTGPFSSASDIVFNPSSNALFVTIKGNPTTSPATPGYIYAWSVRNGRVSQNPVITSIPDLIVDFSLNFLGSDNSALLTDPSFGASILNIPSSLQVTEKAHTAIPLQGAACWGVYSSRFNSAYVIDAGRPNITVLDPASGTIRGTIHYNTSRGGGFDAATNGRYLYVLTGVPTIIVIDLTGSNSGKTPHEVQSFDITALGKIKNWQGMATYPSRGVNDASVEAINQVKK